jgi:rRNA processing protein Gar1
MVKVENTPRIGETVVDENLKPIGRILDLLGPVSSPYAVIKPSIQGLERLTNKPLYLLSSKRRKEKI